MREHVAIIAALPREVKPLVSGWQRHDVGKNISAYSRENAVVVSAGMGAHRAVLALDAALSLQPITSVLSVGLAGSCDTELKVGDVVRAGVVVDSATGERYENSQFKQILVTGGEIASISEKRRLYEAYLASAVDMEASAVARIAAAHGLYFQAIKAISDDADFELQELRKFATSDGQFQESRFAMYAAARPWMWSKLIGLARNSARAIAALTKELDSELEWYRQRG